MVKFDNEIKSFVYSKRDKIIEILKDFVQIPSVKGVAEPNAPYGIKCREALECFCKHSNALGINSSISPDGKYALAETSNKGKHTIGLFSHLDVVPTSNDWIYSSPFDPKEENGYLYGRGVIDDKSGAVISLISALGIKELNLPFSSKLLLFAGSNEETGMNDIEAFVNTYSLPDLSLVIDTAYPIYRGDKSRLTFQVRATTPFNDIIELESESEKTVISIERTLVKYSPELYQELKIKENEHIKITKEDNNILIYATGIATHSALPQNSLNALYLIADLLSTAISLNSTDKAKMEIIKKLTSEYDGKYFGINGQDEFGILTCVCIGSHIDNGYLTLTFNMRFGNTFSYDELLEKINNKFNNIGYKVSSLDYTKGYYRPNDDPFVKAAMNTYYEFTGDYNAKSRLNAGITYAAKLNATALEIGPTLLWDKPFDKPGHGAAHQPDECVSIKGILESIILTIEIIVSLDNELEKGIKNE